MKMSGCCGTWDVGCVQGRSQAEAALCPLVFWSMLIKSNNWNEVRVKFFKIPSDPPTRILPPLLPGLAMALAVSKTSLGGLGGLWTIPCSEGPVVANEGRRLQKVPLPHEQKYDTSLSDQQPKCWKPDQTNMNGPQWKNSTSTKSSFSFSYLFSSNL